MSDIGDALTGDGADGRPYSLSALLAPTPALTLGATSNGLGDDLRLELSAGASFRCVAFAHFFFVCYSFLCSPFLLFAHLFFCLLSSGARSTSTR
jgi:hypothetical protein